MANKGGLGRGLGSLFGSSEQEFTQAQEKGRQEAKAVEVVQDAAGSSQIPADKLFANPDQPRKKFDKGAMEELAASIREHGIIQPIVVVRSGTRYMIIAGERRWRAAQIAGLTEVPAVVKSYTEREIKEIALIENLQREDLNAIETAGAIQRLMAEYKYTQEAVAGRIGKSRPYITNTLRLLELASEVQMMVADDSLSAGHARTLAALKDRAAQIRLAQAAAHGKMSVRELEKAVKDESNPKKAAASAAPFTQSVELKELKNLMQQVFATKVEIFGNDNKGRIYIDYFSRDDIDRIADIVYKLKK